MKKIILFIIFILIFIIIFNSNTIINNIILSFDICFNNLFPSLIPFMFISNILIKYNFVDDISDMFTFFTNKIFKINKNTAFAIVMSMISGTPSNSKYLKDLYDNNLIDLNDIRKCLNFCHFTNPVFIIGTIGLTFLNNKKIGLIILISHFLSSFLIGFIFRNQTITKNNKFTNIKKTTNKKFITILSEAIFSTTNTLLLILGIITFCLIITSLIDILFNINNNYKYIYGILEITQGLKYLSLSNLNISVKAIISSFLISFGGICIHMQVFSIIDNKKIRYFPYLFSRIIHGILSSIITFIIIVFLTN